jgi:hypothetical protein
MKEANWRGFLIGEANCSSAIMQLRLWRVFLFSPQSGNKWAAFVGKVIRAEVKSSLIYLLFTATKTMTKP